MSDAPQTAAAREEAPVGVRAGDYAPELESLRGIAILLVFFFHAYSISTMGGKLVANEPLGFVRIYLEAGHTGVTLFFVLSAFLLFRPYLRERPPAPVEFWRRRALRILPAYYAAVLAGTLATSEGLGDLWRGLPYLVFANSWNPWVTAMKPWSSVWWSLATEVQFYLLLPPVMLALGSRTGRVLVALLGLGWLAAYSSFLAAMWGVGEERGGISLTLLGRAPAFLAGIALAVVDVRHGDRMREWARQKLPTGLGDLLLVALVIGLSFPLAGVVQRGFFAAERFMPGWHISESLYWAGIVFCIRTLPLLSWPLLVNPVLHWMGVLSYSLYLVHTPIIHLTLRPALQAIGLRLGWSWVHFVIVLGVLGLCTLISYVTYNLIEKPFLTRKYRRPAPTSAAP